MTPSHPVSFEDKLTFLEREVSKFRSATGRTLSGEATWLMLRVHLTNLEEAFYAVRASVLHNGKKEKDGFVFPKHKLNEGK